MFSSCILWRFIIGLIMGLLTLFLHSVYGFTYRELMLFLGTGMEFQDKILLCYSKEVKCKQGFTTEILYWL